MQTFHLDINAPAFVRDPYPTLADLRERMPIFYDEVWNKVFFLRYDDISTLLRDKRLGRSITHILSRDELGWPPRFPAPPGGVGPRSSPNPLIRDFDHFQENHMLDNEPPKHTRLKGLMLKAFTPTRVESLRGKIAATVSGLIDRAEDAGRMDLLADYAEPLPVTVIAELLGVPEPDRHLLRPLVGEHRQAVRAGLLGGAGQGGQPSRRGLLGLHQEAG